MRVWKYNIVLMLGGVLIALLLCEVVLRMAGFSYLSLYQYDSDLGAALRPEAEGWAKKEGEAYIKISSAGLRDREHAQAKPPRTLRIAVLGDSYAEALQVPMENAFWSILENKLKACPALAGREPEVINFGVSGYGTAQELIMLRHRVWLYAPDIVLLAFLTGNDVRNNSRILEQDNRRPYFVLSDGRLVPDMTFRESLGFRLRLTELGRWMYWLRYSSRILQVFDEAIRIVTVRNAQVDSISARSHSVNAADQADLVPGVRPWDEYAEAGLDAIVYREPVDPVWKEAWEVTEELILLMRDEVREKGANFLVVTLSNGPQVHPDPAVREAFERHLGVSHLFYPDFRIRSLGERAGFAVLNLAPHLQTYAEEDRVFLHGFEKSGLGKGHWNSEGHRLAGTLMAQKLCGDLLRKTSSSL